MEVLVNEGDVKVGLDNLNVKERMDFVWFLVG